MKNFTNTELIETRAKWGAKIGPFSMLTLVGAIVTNIMGYLQLATILLVVGVISTLVASHLNNRWVRKPLAYEILTTALKKFGNDFILFNHITSVPHVLITPTQIYVIITKKQNGLITVKGAKFSQKFSWLSFFKFLYDEGVGSPVREAALMVARLEKLLHKQLDSDNIPTITPIILFINKDVELHIVTAPSISTLKTNELKNYIRANNKQKQISASQREELIKIINGDI